MVDILVMEYKGFEIDKQMKELSDNLYSAGISNFNVSRRSNKLCTKNCRVTWVKHACSPVWLEGGRKVNAVFGKLYPREREAIDAYNDEYDAPNCSLIDYILGIENEKAVG